jgi:UDP-glucose 4-epimerase
MPSFVMRALCDDPIEVYGGGDQISDCIYVEDVAKVFVAALEFTMKHGSLWKPGGSNWVDSFEVGPDNKEAVTVREIAEMVIKEVASSSTIQDVPMRPGEVSGAVVSARQHTLGPLKEFGIEPQNFVPLEEGIQRTVEYYRDYKREQDRL